MLPIWTVPWWKRESEEGIPDTGKEERDAPGKKSRVRPAFGDLGQRKQAAYGCPAISFTVSEMPSAASFITFPAPSITSFTASPVSSAACSTTFPASSRMSELSLAVLFPPFVYSAVSVMRSAISSGSCSCLPQAAIQTSVMRSRNSRAGLDKICFGSFTLTSFRADPKSALPPQAAWLAGPVPEAYAAIRTDREQSYCSAISMPNILSFIRKRNCHGCGFRVK